MKFDRRNPGRYKLLGKLAVPVDDLIEWADWLQTADRRVGWDEVGPCIVSTVFLGLDHNFLPHGPPLIFETMILRDDEEGYQVRTSTWGQAEVAHRDAVQTARMRVAKAQAVLPEIWGGSKAAR